MIAQTESVLITTLFEMSGITAEKVQQQLTELANNAAQPLILFWDVKDIMQTTTYSRKFLEDHILNDPRVQLYERQREKGGKRVWEREPTAKVIRDIIMNDWI